LKGKRKSDIARPHKTPYGMTMKMDVIKKFIDEYKTKQSIYEDFAKNVGSFLEILLENNEFRYQAGQ